MRTHSSILVTGATGLLGRAVVRRLLAGAAQGTVFVLVRDLARWRQVARELTLGDGVCPIVGDLRANGLALEANDRTRLRGTVTSILHLGADTTFSAPLERARTINTRGTAHVLELAAECLAPVQVTYVSTAFVAGRRTGVIREDCTKVDAWVNAYEQSKYEAEQLVRDHGGRWVILRSSTIVCDDLAGHVTQLNAVHRALQLYRAGLVPMMPGTETSSVDVVTTAYVADAITRLMFHDGASGNVVNLCAGVGALSLGELLDITYRRWSSDADWRRRGIARPAIADLPTYALFERTVEEVGNPSIKRLTRALSHFVPQLALPKLFDTTNADALLGSSAPPVRTFWGPMLDHLLALPDTASRTTRAA